MKKQISVIALVVFIFTACGDLKEHRVIVENHLNFNRKEVVAIACEDLKPVIKGEDMEKVLIYDPQTSQYLVTQLLDNDMDGEVDELLFQAEVKANSISSYLIEYKRNALELKPAISLVTYSRFVPERIDDYAWENDRVAFRTYGPEAERLVKEGEPGGTLSSGIDLWLKRVDYPIIDKWYLNNVQEAGYYHIDHGEGYDPYHVGNSRGTGGTGIWISDSLFISDNFVRYRSICTGPLRTVFELDYAPYSTYNLIEKKRISLDLGSNFSKFEISLTGNLPQDSYSVGIALHEGEGKISINKESGTFLHWEPIDGEYLGEGLVMDPKMVNDAFKIISEVPDQNQLLVTTHAQTDITYYAGFAWTRSRQVKGQADWAKMLQHQAEIIASPFFIHVK